MPTLACISPQAKELPGLTHAFWGQPSGSCACFYADLRFLRVFLCKSMVPACVSVQNRWVLVCMRSREVNDRPESDAWPCPDTRPRRCAAGRGAA
eukprot:3160775-Rhodomonas_salina.1